MCLEGRNYRSRNCWTGTWWEMYGNGRTGSMKRLRNCYPPKATGCTSRKRELWKLLSSQRKKRLKKKPSFNRDGTFGGPENGWKTPTTARFKEAFGIGRRADTTKFDRKEGTLEIGKAYWIRTETKHSYP